MWLFSWYKKKIIKNATADLIISKPEFQSTWHILHFKFAPLKPGEYRAACYIKFAPLNPGEYIRRAAAMKLAMGAALLIYSPRFKGAKFYLASSSICTWV